MLTVLVTNPKGGCGKTTLATNLAGAFARTGFTTVLADCDRQKSSLGWLKSRPDTAPAITGLDWTKDVGKTPKKTQRLVVDAPAAIRKKGVQELVREADVIVIPVLPSAFDLATASDFLRVLDKLKPIRNNKRAVALVGNRVRLRTTAASQLEEFLNGLKQDAVTQFRDSQIYLAAASAGLSIFDMPPSRTERVVSDWRLLLRFIGDVAIERERKK